MKKKLFGLFGVLFLSIGLLAACAEGDDDAGDVAGAELIGTWAYENFAGWTYTFYEDGTGVRGAGADIGDFEWSVNDDTLRIECSVQMFNIPSERWTFTIENNVLTLDSQQANITYRYNRR